MRRSAHKRLSSLRRSVNSRRLSESIFSTNGSRREHGQYVLLAKPLQSSSFSESKHSHEQAKANTCGLPLVEYRSPSPFIRRENAVYVCANSAPVAQPDRATDF